VSRWMRTPSLPASSTGPAAPATWPRSSPAALDADQLAPVGVETSGAGDRAGHPNGDCQRDRRGHDPQQQAVAPPCPGRLSQQVSRAKAGFVVGDRLAAKERCGHGSGGLERRPR
jgi:hypothetical protein